MRDRIRKRQIKRQQLGSKKGGKGDDRDNVYNRRKESRKRSISKGSQEENVDPENMYAYFKEMSENDAKRAEQGRD